MSPSADALGLRFFPEGLNLHAVIEEASMLVGIIPGETPLTARAKRRLSREAALVSDLRVEELRVITMALRRVF